jgi:hypothetical protein
VPERWDDWSDKGFGYLHEEEEKRPESGQLTPEGKARLLRWFWLIALVMMLAGFGIMILLLTGRSPFG